MFPRFLLILLVALLWIAPAARPAAAAQPAAGRASFALVVTNNRSSGLARPDLHYADDDGAKYYETLSTVMPEENIWLLTEFDRDTERLFPHLKSKLSPPDRPHVLGAAEQIARAARAASAAGHTVELYFIFAGHGDVDHGRGFLELSDGPFRSEDLEGLLRSIPAAHAHVILDSCNSFFVLSARKPGGQHFATPADAARSLSERLPNVGLFLSTSAEAEVFEWSELGAGIFSHAVRSGLSGAADANGDGVVTYAELRAFVDISTAEVRNPLYRPQVFARGPNGRDADAFLDLTNAQAARVELDSARRVRLTVRDADDVPWVDVNKEEGAKVTLRLPLRWGLHASLEEREVTASGSQAKRRYALALQPESATVALASLTPTPAAIDARGPNDIFAMLFARPYGPRALVIYEQEEASRPAPVYGISEDDRERMRLLLGEVSDIEQRRRMLGGAAFAGVGLFLGGIGVASLASSNGAPLATSDGSRVPAYVALGAGGGLTLVGLGVLAFPSPAEKLHGDFERGLALHPDNPSLTIAATEKRLFEIADQYRTYRLVARWLGASCALLGVGTLSAAAAAHSSLSSTTTEVMALAGGAATLECGIIAGASFLPDPVERMADLWAKDPGLQRIPRVEITPVIGGTSIGLRATF